MRAINTRMREATFGVSEARAGRCFVVPAAGLPIADRRRRKRAPGPRWAAAKAKNGRLG
jgi:hypothetical protein